MSPAKRNTMILVICAQMAALAAALQYVMASVPNIEPVSLIIMLCASLFGVSAFAMVIVYIILYGLIMDFGIFTLGHVLAWPILCLAAICMKRFKNPFAWAALSGIFGFLFGFFHLPFSILALGINTKEKLLIYIANDMPFNAVHAVGNFFIALFLFLPLRNLLENAMRKLKIFNGQKEK